MSDSIWLSPFTSTNKKIPKWVLSLKEYKILNPYDMLWMLPNKYQPITDEKNIFSLADLNPGQIVRVRGKVSQLYCKPVFYRGRKGPLLHHAFAKITSNKYQWKINAFNIYPQTKEKWQQWQQQSDVTLIGTFDLQQGKISLNNVKEDISGDVHKSEHLITYPTLKGVTAAQWKKLWDKYITPNWTQFFKNTQHYALEKSFKVLHGITPSQKNEEEFALNILKEYEFFCEQLLLLQKKEMRKKHSISPLKVGLIDDLLKLTPWPLTTDQKKSLQEILLDLSKNYPMRRMLQGEVGSGKTILAFLTAFTLAKENNIQVAIIAPTETLARQHFEKWQSFFKTHHHHIQCAALFASIPKGEKQTILENIKTGKIHIIIGTHALFQKDVQYKDLRYIIIDEQHRFGVEQRKALYQKGHSPHTLMMSATPIPRSLGLTQFGDIDQSIMQHTPFGEKKIKTRLVFNETYAQFLTFMKTRLDLGEQAYVIAPVIEESEHFTYHLKYLENFFTEKFPDKKIATLHGKLKEEEQLKSFKEFQLGQASILIATTMIEVGIDVANATVIAIYHPEQFGLSSLHQLRGRVGRSQKTGFCFLVTPYVLENESRERLEFFEKNLDGFVLAEKDFNLRGQGNLWGVEQSGKLSPYRVARIPEDKELLLEAAEIAKNYFPSKDVPIPSHLMNSHFEGEIKEDYWL
jgi:ATP-dependent DNA helicase RecG